MVGHAPEAVGIEIYNGQVQDQKQRRQFRLEAQRNEQHANAADCILHDRCQGEFVANDGQKHDHQEHTASELHVVLRGIAVHRGYASEDCSSFFTVFHHQQDQASDESARSKKAGRGESWWWNQGRMLPEQETWFPDDSVCDRLEKRMGQSESMRTKSPFYVQWELT